MHEFSKALQCCNRKIVIHETCFYDALIVLNLLQENDILFFDDCLYSLYVFLANNIEQLKRKHVVCVLSFSTGIFRRNNLVPKYFAKCAECHDNVHANVYDAYSAYMSLSELKLLLANDNVFLACHGDQHLRLSEVKSSVSKAVMFKNDITVATDKLKQFGFETDIFVYPYAYDDILLAERTLKCLRYTCVFAGKNSLRIPFESLVDFSLCK